MFLKQVFFVKKSCDWLHVHFTADQLCFDVRRGPKWVVFPVDISDGDLIKFDQQAT